MDERKNLPAVIVAQAVAVPEDKYGSLVARGLVAVRDGKKLALTINNDVLYRRGIESTALHVEAGMGQFADYSKAMIGELGEAIRPYLRSFYEAVRFHPGVDTQKMTPIAEIDVPGDSADD